jgi:hypothetical protein
LGALVDAGEGEAGLAQVLIHGPAGERWAEPTPRNCWPCAATLAGGAPPRDRPEGGSDLLGPGLLAIYFLLGEWLSLFWLLALGAGLVWDWPALFERLGPELEQRFRRTG